jgi:hypothetical protein
MHATLQEASSALWLATLSLMTAYMQQQAPAHRYLLARRIARNFTTLREQECFSADTRETFGRLAARWEQKAERLNPNSVPAPAGMFARLQRLFAR